MGNRLRSEWVLTSSTHSGSCTWYELSQAAWRPYIRTLHWKSSVIQLLTITQILIFTETVPVLPLGGNYFWNNMHYNYFVPIIRILWKRPQLHVRSITASHNDSSKHNFQTDSVKIICEYKSGSNMGMKKQKLCLWFRIKCYSLSKCSTRFVLRVATKTKCKAVT